MNSEIYCDGCHRFRDACICHEGSEKYYNQQIIMTLKRFPMKIIMETGKPRNYQCGDWSEDHEGTTKIITSEMPLKSQVAVAIHELIEKLLCDENEITDHMVTMFDAQFENERNTGAHPIDAEPGDDQRSPYRTQHQAATFAERAICAALGLDWSEHEGNVYEATS